MEVTKLEYWVPMSAKALSDLRAWQQDHVYASAERCGAKNPFLWLMDASFPRCSLDEGHEGNHEWQGHSWRGNDKDGYLPA